MLSADNVVAPARSNLVFFFPILVLKLSFSSIDFISAC